MCESEPQTQLHTFSKIPMVHDGSCMFRAISYGLYGIQGNFLSVRRQINKHIVKNWEKYKNFAVNKSGKQFASINAFRRFAYTPGRMGDFADLHAAAEVFGCQIIVHRDKSVTCVGETGPKIHLSFEGSVDEGMYDFLEETTGQGRASYAAVVSSVGISAAQVQELGDNGKWQEARSGASRSASSASDGGVAVHRATPRVSSAPQGGVARPRVTPLSSAPRARGPADAARQGATRQGAAGAARRGTASRRADSSVASASVTQGGGRTANNAPQQQKTDKRLHSTQFGSTNTATKQGNSTAQTLNKHRAGTSSFNIPLQNKYSLLDNLAKTDETQISNIKEVSKTPCRKTLRNKKIKEVEIFRVGEKESSEAMTVESPSVEFDENDETEEEEMVALMDIKVNSEKVAALLDSGANVNCIDVNFLKSVEARPNITKTTKALVTANKQSLKTIGLWKGQFQIGFKFFSTVFYVCKGISQNVILGNKFLLKHDANICYRKLKATFHTAKDERVQVPFGVFYRSVNNNNLFRDLEVDKIYTGPTFIKAVKPVQIPPRTIKWVKITTTPHNILQDTTFVGNPNILKHYQLMVSDFVLGPEDRQYIQITNLGGKRAEIDESLNLAVDIEYEDIFYPAAAEINSVNSGSDFESVKFNINKDLSPEQKQIAINLLNKYENVFVSHVSELKRCKYPPVKIEYNKDKIIRQRNYRMSPDEKDFVEKYIQDLLKADLVEYCTSVYCTPILVVTKPNHTKENPSFRLVQDFRKLNKILTDIRYPIPDQQELIDSFQGKFWHSVTDNCSGFTQLTLDPSCRDITSFDSPSGSRLRWKGMPMGLSVAPSLYALAMDHILTEMKQKKKVVNYFDDSHIGTKTFEQHVEVLEEYFELLEKFEVKLNKQKSTFFQKKVKFLGLELDGVNVSIAQKRIEAIRKIKPPENKDKLRSVLGVFNYNRKFIEGYSKIAQPLNELLREDIKFEWTERHQNSFEQLKTILSNPPSLRLYNPKFNNRVCVDASYQGLGCALYQKDPINNKYAPVAFASRKIKDSEKRLPIYFLECSALVYAFIVFRCYLQNRNVETEVLTDHQSLQSLLRTEKPEGPMAKHIIFLSQFRFTIKFRPGKTNLDADALSRHPVWETKHTVDEMVEEVFPDRLQNSCQISPVTTRAQLAQDKQNKEAAQDLDTQNQKNDNSQLLSLVLNKSSVIKDLQNSDPNLSEIIQQAKTNTLTHKNGDFELKEDLLYKRHNSNLLLVVPRSCRKYILAEFHDNRGHRHSKHLVQNILTTFWWETMAKDAETYVKSCHFCMSTESNPKYKPGFLKPAMPTKMFSQIACDFVGEFKASANKNKHFCVIIDAYSKYMWTKPVKTADTENAISCLESFTLQFGLCDTYTSDSASYFTSFAFQEMLKKWDIFHNSFRKVPHCNGQVERSIQSLKKILSEFLLQFGEDWESYLQFATFIYNVNYHNTIGCSPFYAVHGFHPILPGIQQLLPDSGQDLKSKINKHTKFLEDLKFKINESQIKNKQYYDKGRQEATYTIGQTVRVRDETDDISWPNKKINWVGPYKIVGKKSSHFYFVMVKEKDSHGKLRDVAKEYHIVNIMPYHDRPKDLQLHDPP